MRNLRRWAKIGAAEQRCAISSKRWTLGERLTRVWVMSVEVHPANLYYDMRSAAQAGTRRDDRSMSASVTPLSKSSSTTLVGGMVITIL